MFAHIFEALAAENEAEGTVMIDSTPLKAHRTAPVCSKRGFSATHRAYPRGA